MLVLAFALPLLAACSDYSNKPAAEALAAAVKTHQRQVGHYPSKLKDLVPNYLRELPKSASKYSSIGYAVEPGLDECWIVYGVHRDRFEEFDCNAGEWTNVEVEDSHVFRRNDVEWIRPQPATS